MALRNMRRALVAGLLMASLGVGQGAHAATAQDVLTGPLLFDTGSPAPSFRTARTIPYWSSSFTYQGAVYPYTMVGTDPASTSAPTTIPTEIIPLRLVFADGLVSDGGGSALTAALSSPSFNDAPYSTGTTQFGNAVQRASFWDKVSQSNWGVLLATPTVYPTVTIDVPGSPSIEQDFTYPPTGETFAGIDKQWFDQRLQELLGSLHISPETLPIFQTRDVVLFRPDGRCCSGGFHGTFSSVNGNGNQQVQTFIWETYVGVGFWDPNDLGILPLTHEISEWMNDPFINNLVPRWSAVGNPAFCSSLLETGDPLEFLSDAAYPVTINGVTYRPQNEVLLSWFTRQSPSTGIGGAYSYPNTTLTSAPSSPC